MKLVVFLFLAALLPASATAATDPRIGSWTLLSAQSTLTPPDTLTVTSTHELVHIELTGETHLDFTARANGHDTAVPGNPAFDHVLLHRIDKRATDVTEMKNGTLVARVSVRASSDGKQLTVTTATPGHPDQVAIWIRSGEPHHSPDPLSGVWVQDLSQTHLKQGIALKIRPDAGGGVQFTGDYTYVARLDGRPYNVQNSRNDTVSLALVDPHTVEATYRRDDQISQRDRWVVSDDGQRMTLATTATLETGQHLTEKLVFRRQ